MKVKVIRSEARTAEREINEFIQTVKVVSISVTQFEYQGALIFTYHILYDDSPTLRPLRPALRTV